MSYIYKIKRYDTELNKLKNITTLEQSGDIIARSPQAQHVFPERCCCSNLRLSIDLGYHLQTFPQTYLIAHVRQARCVPAFCEVSGFFFLTLPAPPPVRVNLTGGRLGRHALHKALVPSEDRFGVCALAKNVSTEAQ